MKLEPRKIRITPLAIFMVSAAVLVFSRPACHAALSASAADAGRRVLTLLAVVGGEYREAFDEAGVLQRPLEYDEARSFLAEARVRWEHLGIVDGDNGVGPSLAEVAAAIDNKVPSAALLALIANARMRVSAATGLEEEVYPPEEPSAERGAAIFREHCASCHGSNGAGDGPDAARLERKPANFSDVAFMRGETPLDFFHVITVGRRGAAMPAWGDVLTVQQRWDVISYLWGLAHDRGRMAEGQGVFLSQCASCHGAAGDGVGPFAAALLTPVPDFRQTPRLSQRTDAQLFAAVRDGVSGSAMPAFRALTDDERWNAVAFLRVLSLGGLHAPNAGNSTVSGTNTGAQRSAAESRAAATGPGQATESNALQETQGLLDVALTAYRSNDRGAGDRVSDAYLRFEPMEKKLRAVAPDLTRRVEARFLELRGVVATPGSRQQAEAVAAAITRDLDAAQLALEPPTHPYALFVQSATIILREGFEVVLIIGALLAYVEKSGNQHMRRPILTGAATGVGLSLATACALQQLLRGTTTGAAEALEGGTMLLAAAVLFWVSYWLVSKAQADKWQRFIQGKVQAAVSMGSGLALGGAAFLAVYREGVETVLFYEALLGSATVGIAPVVGGFTAGCIALVIAYAMFFRFGMRLPIRPFFLATSVLLYAMAIAFAGRGVAELQEAGWIGVTLVTRVPRLDFLGVYPSVETLSAQAILVALLIYALGVTLRRRWRAHGAKSTDTLSRGILQLP
jgi:high-affinity iron transporter